MLDAPHITHTAAQQTAVIHLTIPRAEIQQAMGPGIAELMAAVTAQGIGPTGPWFSHHFQMHPDRFDLEIGVPVSGPVMPAATVARAVLHGNYDRLAGGWGELLAWVEAEGHESAPDLWEIYVKGPESDPDPAAWRSELNKPLIA